MYGQLVRLMWIRQPVIVKGSGYEKPPWMWQHGRRQALNYHACQSAAAMQLADSGLGLKAWDI